MTSDRAVDAHEHRCARELPPIEQIADRNVGGHTVNALFAADVDRQLGCLVIFVGEFDAVEVVPQQPGALQAYQAALVHPKYRFEQSLDDGAGVHRDHRNRWFFRQAQGLVASKVMPRAEAGDPAQHDAGRDAPLFIKTQHALGYEATVHALTLTEVRAELETNLVHTNSLHCGTAVFDSRRSSASTAPLAGPATNTRPLPTVISVDSLI